MSINPDHWRYDLPLIIKVAAQKVVDSPGHVFADLDEELLEDLYGKLFVQKIGSWGIYLSWLDQVTDEKLAASQYWYKEYAVLGFLTALLRGYLLGGRKTPETAGARDRRLDGLSKALGGAHLALTEHHEHSAITVNGLLGLRHGQLEMVTLAELIRKAQWEIEKDRAGITNNRIGGLLTSGPGTALPSTIDDTRLIGTAKRTSQVTFALALLEEMKLLDDSANTTIDGVIKSFLIDLGLRGDEAAAQDTLGSAKRARQALKQ